MIVADTYKTENEVFKIIRDSIIAGLKMFGLDDQGIDVRRFAQANFNHGDKLVLMNLVKSVRVGFQSVTHKWIPQDTSVTPAKPAYMRRTDTWIEEQAWQISTLKKMQKDDTTSTITAEDIANALISWFNGAGSEYLRTHGIGTLLIDPNSVIVYNDDSDLYQRRPVFMLKIQVPKRFNSAEDAMDMTSQYDELDAVENGDDKKADRTGQGIFGI